MRTRALSMGWYPDSERQIQDQIEVWKSGTSVFPVSGRAVAGVVPHAGWSYCGSMIASVLSAVAEPPHTVVVLGGHNPSGAALISYPESRWSFPGAELIRDEKLVEKVEIPMNNRYELVEESAADNTVEVVMAMVAALYPKALWAAWRIPADERALAFGEVLKDAVDSSGESVLVLGSTDLTHYGPGFNFVPPESLTDPAGWAAKNDLDMLNALKDFDGNQVLFLGNNAYSACSSGGAAAALSYARAAGAAGGRLLEYRSSLDVHLSSSFVGYGSIIWE